MAKTETAKDAFKKYLEHAKDYSIAFIKKVHDFFHNVTRKMILLLTVIFVLGYFFLMLISYNIDTSLSFAETPAEKEHPQTFQTFQALIEREIHTHTFVPNRPFFSPSARLSNMGAYQTGIIEQLSIYLTFFASNTRNENLSAAAELLRYPPNIWLFGSSKDGKIAKSSTQQYKRARHEIRTYVSEVSADKYFISNAVNIRPMLTFIRQDLLRISSELSLKISKRPSPTHKYDTSELFFFTKGRLYVHALYLRDFAHDAPLSDTERQYVATALLSLEKFLGLSPWFVLNSNMNRTFLANHLAYEAYYIAETTRSLYDLERMLRANDR